jgi:hypothetical protein
MTSTLVEVFHLYGLRRLDFELLAGSGLIDHLNKRVKSKNDKSNTKTKVEVSPLPKTSSNGDKSFQTSSDEYEYYKSITSPQERRKRILDEISNLKTKNESDVLKAYGFDFSGNQEQKDLTELDVTPVRGSKVKENKEKEKEQKEKTEEEHKEFLYYQKLRKSIMNFLDSIFHILRDKPKGSWVKIFKYIICNYFSTHFPTTRIQETVPLPKCVDSSDELQDKFKFIFGGIFYKFQKRIKMNVNIYSSFCVSILQSKKGAPRVGDELLRDAEKNLYDHFTTPETYSVNDQQKILLKDISEEEFLTRPHTRKLHNALKQRKSLTTREEMLGQVRRTVREVFRGRTFTKAEREDLMIPSCSADYNNTCSKQGMFGELKNELPTFKLELEGKVDVINFVDTEGIGHGAFQSTIQTQPLDLLKTAIYDHCYKKAIEEVPYAVAQGLPEALKVRTITKGPPYIYYILKPLQKWMFKIMKQFDCFCIGKDVNEEVLTERFRILEHFPGLGFLSGDYDSATDFFSRYIADVAIDELFDVLNESGSEISEDYKTLMKKALIDHIFVDKEVVNLGYKSSATVINGTAAQETGQPMGSIISFIFLCLANAAICRRALEKSWEPKGGFSLREAPMIINGDDCVLYGPNNLGFHWKQALQTLNLKKSLGKCYHCSDMLTLNSRFFRLTAHAIGSDELINFRTNQDRYYNHTNQSQGSSESLKYFNDEVSYNDFDTYSYLKDRKHPLLEKRSRKGLAIKIYKKLLRLEPAPKQKLFEQISFINLGNLYGYDRSGSPSEKSFVQLASCYEAAIAELPIHIVGAFTDRFIYYHRKVLPDGLEWNVPTWCHGMGFHNLNKEKATFIKMLLNSNDPGTAPVTKEIILHDTLTKILQSKFIFSKIEILPDDDTIASDFESFYIYAYLTASKKDLIRRINVTEIRKKMFKYTKNVKKLHEMALTIHSQYESYVRKGDTDKKHKFDKIRILTDDELLRRKQFITKYLIVKELPKQSNKP